MKIKDLQEKLESAEARL